jgi:cytochrome c-type biogenesis protein CcmH
MMKQTFFSILILIFTFSLSLITVVYAQEANPETISDDEVNQIAKQLYCPVCENIPLDVCGTQACAQWRELIREKLALGWSEKEIKNYFVLQYGDRVLAEPPRRGLNWLVYLVPPVAFLAGIFILYRGFQSWREREDVDVEEAQIEDEPMDEYIAQMEEALRQSKE